MRPWNEWLTKLPLKKLSVIRLLRLLLDKIAGKVVAGGDKTAGKAEAIHDKIAEVAELLVDQSIEAIRKAVERDDEEADEDIIDKIARGEAAHDNTARERVDEESNEDTIEETAVDSIIKLSWRTPTKSLTRISSRKLLTI